MKKTMALMAMAMVVFFIFVKNSEADAQQVSYASRNSSLPISIKEVVLVEKIDLFGSSQEGDHLKYIDNGREIVLFYKLIPTGISREDIASIEVMATRAGMNEMIFVPNDFYSIAPNGVIKIFIGLTVDMEPVEILQGTCEVTVHRR